MVDAVLEDYQTAPISPEEKALFGFLEKVTLSSRETTPADVQAVRDAGWSQRAIYDAITVCALFQFYTTWVDATGVHDMPAAAYEASGERLALRGYVAGD